jgi:serine/threonine-protein kinase HipA
MAQVDNDLEESDAIVPADMDSDAAELSDARRSGKVLKDIYFAGQSAEKHEKLLAWYATKGHLVRVARGIYLNAQLSEEERAKVILDHAIRITMYRNPKGTLAGSSAFLHAPADGYVFLASSSYSRPQVIGGVLTISHLRYEIPMAVQSDEIHTVADPSGHFKARVLSDDLLILSSFRTHSSRPIQAMLSLEDVDKVIDRRASTLGGLDVLQKRLEKMAKTMGYYGKAVRDINEHIRRRSSYTTAKRNLYDFEVLWNKNRVGTLSFDGASWLYEKKADHTLPLTLCPEVTAKRVPSFLLSLLPESKIQRLHGESGLIEFKVADRYISNINVRTLDKVSEPVIVDTLEGSLMDFITDHAVFTGNGDGLRHIFSSEKYLDALSRAQQDQKSPRISGLQQKLACNLDANGNLTLAHGKSFTHIAKPSPRGFSESFAAIEWYSMTLACYCHIETEVYAIADLQGGSPVFIAERFDVRQGYNDRSNILTEDFWSIAGLRDSNDKYNVDLMEVADALMKHSTAPDLDGRQLLKQIVLSWFIGNHDMHTKNIMMIKHANADRSGFESIRLAPAYDLMVTRIYPGDPATPALFLAGSKDYSVASLRALGSKLDIPGMETVAIIEDIRQQLREFAPVLRDHLPPEIVAHPVSMADIHRACTVILHNCETLALEPVRKPPRAADRQSSIAKPRFIETANIAKPAGKMREPE